MTKINWCFITTWLVVQGETQKYFSGDAFSGAKKTFSGARKKFAHSVILWNKEMNLFLSFN